MAPPDREVLDRLVRIETKIDLSISRVDDHETRLRRLEKVRGDDHETRLRRLERVLWVAAGAAAAGGGIVGSIIRQAIAG